MFNNNSYPLVTIGIPTYNRANGYLPQALRTALRQTYPNLEIIVSDNCSPDNTEAVVRSFADPRINYFRQDPAVTPNDNFNFCLDQARGDYFLLLHDDDMIDPDFVETCLKAAGYKTHFGILRTGTRVIEADGTIKTESPNRVGGLPMADFLLGWFCGQTSLYLCSTLFNMRRLKEFGGFHSKHDLFQDVIAEVQLAAKFGRVDVWEVKASFRKHPDTRTVAAKVNEWSEDGLMLLDVILEAVPEKREQVRYEGSRYLTRMNYELAMGIESPVQRLRTYMMVFKKFNYHYSPLEFFVVRSRNKVKKRIRFLKKKVKHALVSS